MLSFSRPVDLLRPDHRAARVLLVALAALAATASGAQAAEPTAFATAQGTCNANGTASTNATPVTQDHPRVVVRYSVLSGRLDPPSFASRALEAGESSWFRSSSLTANQTPDVFDVYCPEVGSFTASWYDAPSAPTSYSGVGDGQLRFLLGPATTQFVADVSVTSGAVALSFPGRSRQIFASSGTYSMGTVYGSTTDAVDEVQVEALDGPRPSWTVNIRPLPVVLSTVGFSVPAAPSGAPVQLRYSPTGDTTVTAVIANAAGAPVKTLASGLAVEAGNRTLTWDGRGDSGQPLPDGLYGATLTSRDFYGGTNAASTVMRLDSTAPDLRVTTPPVIAPNDAVTVAVSDPSGVESGSLQVTDSYGGTDLYSGQNAMSYKPYDGWKPGQQKLTLRAEDTIGNQQTITYAFTVAVPKPPAPPAPKTSMSCTKANAQATILSTGVFDAAMLRFGTRKSLMFDTFSVFKLWCADFTGDGRKDMGVQLTCCTVSSPRPLVIFRNTTKGWRVGFGQFNSQAWAPKRVGRTLRYRKPVYRGGDANCCPSSYRYYKLSYSKSKFRLQRVKAPQRR